MLLLFSRLVLFYRVVLRSVDLCEKLEGGWKQLTNAEDESSRRGVVGLVVMFSFFLLFFCVFVGTAGPGWPRLMTGLEARRRKHDGSMSWNDHLNSVYFEGYVGPESPV